MFMIECKKNLTLNFYRGSTISALTEALQLETPTLITSQRSWFSLKLMYTAIFSISQQQACDDDELPIEVFAEEINVAISLASNEHAKNDDEIFYDFSEVILKQIILHEQR